MVRTLMVRTLMPRKLLLAHDGSEAADLILPDLARAGLGDDVDCEVVHVKPYLPPAIVVGLDTWTPSAEDFEILEATARSEAAKVADSVAARVRRSFPSWRVRSTGLVGSAAAEIVQHAGATAADLVAVGARGHSRLATLLLGSVAQSLVRESPCSVRVARAHAERSGSPVLVAGIDGSRDAHAAMLALGDRSWPRGTIVHVVTILDPPLSARLGGREGGAAALERARLVAASHARTLSAAGLDARPQVREGRPKEDLPAVARDVGADAIVIGARGLAATPRIPTGSVAASIVQRATCSVEVVRAAPA